MAVELYKHNLDAYNAAKAMLAETGKAAVIHPTGTGKSFIGFRLAEDNPDKRILWLTPSDYIVKTQLENLKREGGSELDNITFVTYARLMRMTDEELEELKPEMCITDEMHRLGAQWWGAGFDKLCEIYPNMKLLGLSATHIRYLDNQRDMAEELFDGNIASEMTLGEAIAKGVLSAPKYVIAVYEYKKELDKYSRRVAKARSKVVRDKAEKYLEALRRALDNADGLDEIFSKHISGKTGKYIVFCANKAHMQTMAENAPDWFSKIDRHPSIYSAYSDNPESSSEFEAFKADKSDHLKLLFCIDMLNEGVHVDDIDGVILLRPTVSPIIYKQQIGRALAAGSKKTPVIFDIVLNFENLYSISDIKDEMSEAIQYCISTGEEYEIVNDTFTLIDEVRECRSLFNELERTLSASWDCMYAAAKEYYAEHGDLIPLQSYTSDEGYHLGQWIVSQRIAYKNGNLSKSRILRLEQIGMDWQTANERQWESSFNKAKAVYDKYGNLDNVTNEINRWLYSQRKQYKQGILSKDRYDRLSEIGMIWILEDKWPERYNEAKAYYEAHGNLDIPADYISDSGSNLGRWYRRVRRDYIDGTLSEERKQMLENIGMDAVSVKIRTWMNYYSLAKSYYEEHGNLRVHVKYETDDGIKLGAWISGQRYMYSKNKLKKKQIELLESIGMEWHMDKSRWEVGYEYARRYYDEYGNIDVIAGYMTDDGFALGQWILMQRNKYKNGKLSAAQIKKLEALNIVWDIYEARWIIGYKYMCEYKQLYSNTMPLSDYMTDDGFALGVWAANQRSKRRSGSLSDERIKQLEAIGFIWEPNKANWQKHYAEAKKYYEHNGSISVSKTYVTDGGVRLRYWIDTQKKAYKKGKLDNSQIKKLELIGVL